MGIYWETSEINVKDTQATSWVSVRRAHGIVPPPSALGPCSRPVSRHCGGSQRLSGRVATARLNAHPTGYGFSKQCGLEGMSVPACGDGAADTIRWLSNADGLRVVVRKAKDRDSVDWMDHLHRRTARELLLVRAQRQGRGYHAAAGCRHANAARQSPIGKAINRQTSTLLLKCARGSQDNVSVSVIRKS